MTVTESQTQDPPELPAADNPLERCAAAPPRHPRPDGEDRYTISEVAAWTGLSAHTLRWYERIGLMPHIDRSHTGQRRFSNRDLDWLTLVGKLRLTGMPVADMVRYAELVRAGEHTFAERRQLLVRTRADVRHRIAELQDTLSVLDLKIGFYSDAAPTAGAAPTDGAAPAAACEAD
ncbi:MerR family transcriptional regulator [Streptomyces sp. 549]|uniref:MerR family transcriptional regulator n=1 Tax=Streptomyces sp. 549 TaxID=3049076 RepID=UPI0024C2DC9D|nr:MerR family transcriptional regulator [Streptomyces sp. 549]MDK1473963.1 MerR family transcriptional regulator [Streptomyces sp. 549]